MDQTTGIRTLVVEHDRALLEIVCEELRARGHTTVAAETVADGLEQLESAEFEVALVDLTLPDGSGIDVLKRIVEDGVPTEAIVLAAEATVDRALQAMKLGAYDFVTDPARVDRLEWLVARAAEKSRLRRENAHLRRRLEGPPPADGLVSDDSTMRELLATVDRVALSDVPVLIQGEGGTGKELLARAVHRLSARHLHPFVAIKCATVPEDRLESELFGDEKGAFAGARGRKPGLVEVADKGVLFVDEVCEASPTVQGKLLRAIEAREFFRVGGTRPVRMDVRVVSSTKKNVKTEMQEGRLREDLYYRLSGATLRLPPLRERKSDIALLARQFLDRGARKKLTSRAVEALQAYAWPGNVRELRMVMDRAALLASSETLDAADLPLDVRDHNWKAAAVKTGLSLAEVEKEYIETVLRQNEGHRGKTARALGIDPKTLYNKLGPERPRTKKPLA